VTTPVLPPLPLLVWSASMETGNLGEWSGIVNSGSANSVAVTAFSAGIPAKTGNWVMRQSVNGSIGGTRMMSYPGMDALARAGTTFYVSWWDYYPAKITFGPFDMFSIFQIDSRDSNGVYSPIWDLDLNGSNFTLQLVWSPNNKAPPGPHAGESGKRYHTSTQAIPVGQWVFFEVMIKPSADFTGAVKIWLNGAVVFDLTGVKTRFPDVGVGGYMYTEHNAYGSGLTPTPAVHYVDDVTVSLGRMPSAP
jgi:polysaccharide lyase-like protein